MRLLNVLFESKNQGIKKININRLINSGDINESLIRLDDYICNLCEFGHNMEPLSDPQKIFYCIQNFEKEMGKDGFKEFYYNSGDLADDTYFSLRVTGALKTSDILKEANDQFPGGTVPKEGSERHKIMEEIKENSDVVWKELDQEFLAHEDDLNVLKLEFVRKNKSFF